MISELISLARGALTLDDATFVEHTQSRDGLKRGLLLIVVIALLASVFTFLGDVVGSFGQPDFDEIQRQIEQQIEMQRQFNPGLRDPEFQKYFQGSLREGMAMGREIAALPANIRFLPHWLGNLLEALGTWLSKPIAWIGAWAWYALWVLLFAKLLGGRATLERMLTATSLFVIPNILYIITDLFDLFGSIPAVGGCISGLGGLIGLIPLVWGIAIYIKATATANEMSMGKAALAAALPLLLAIVLVILAMGAIALLIIVSG